MQWGDIAETLGYYEDDVGIIDNHNIAVDIFQHQVGNWNCRKVLEVAMAKKFGTDVGIEKVLTHSWRENYHR
jgi:hypothetical protein